MSGKVPPSSRAGSRRAASSQRAKAANLYERFTGHDAEEIGTVNISPLKDGEVLAVIGECDGVLYTTVRDGVEEKYIHEFRKSDKPLLCVNADGTQIHLIEGRYLFTEKGIVDRSDRKNWPKGR